MPINPSLTDDEDEHKVLRPYRGKESDAIDQNIKLERGEIFIEYSDDGIGTGIGRMKMGDGSTLYRNLPYLFDQTDLSDSFLKKFAAYPSTQVVSDNTLLAMIANNKDLATITKAERKLIENRIAIEGTTVAKLWSTVMEDTGNNTTVSYGYDGDVVPNLASTSLRQDINELWFCVFNNSEEGIGNLALRYELDDVRMQVLEQGRHNTTGDGQHGVGPHVGDATTVTTRSNETLREDVNTLWEFVFDNPAGGYGNFRLRADVDNKADKAFKTFAVVSGGTTTNIVADSNVDKLTLVASDNITLEPDANADKIVIKSNDTNTTYAFEGSTNCFKVTPSDGSGTKVIHVDPLIINNVTGSGSAEHLTMWDGLYHIVNGPVIGSSTVSFLRNDGQWATPGNADYATKSGTATYATKAGSDESGNNIKATYANSLTVDGYTLTLKNKNGAALSTITTTESKTVTAASNSSTVTAGAGDGSVYLNHVENNTVKSSHNIKGDYIAVTSNDNGVITLNNIGVREINKSGREGYIQVKAGYAPATDLEVKGVPGMYSDINNASTGIKTQLSDVRDYVYNNSTYSNSHLYDMINHAQYHTNQDWYYIGDTYYDSNKTNPNGASLHLGNESWTHDAANPKHIMIADGLPWKGTYIIFYKFKISNITYNLKRTTGSIAINTTYGATDTECCFSWGDLGPNPVKSLSSTEGIIFLTVNNPVSTKYKILLDIVSYIFDSDYENDSPTMRQYSYYLKYKLNIIGIGDHNWPN